MAKLSKLFYCKKYLDKMQKDKEKAFNILEQGLKRTEQTHQRTPEFFLNPKIYKPYIECMEKDKIESIKILILDCTAHSSFYPEKVAMRFLEYFSEMIKYSQRINQVKVKLSGFNLDQELNFGSNRKKLIEIFCKILADKIRQLISLQIRVSNVKNCSIEDFKSIVGLGVNLQALVLKNLSYEFSDWTFPPNQSLNAQKQKIDQIMEKKKMNPKIFDRTKQPSFKEFIKMLNEAFEGTVGGPMVTLNKFRIQISTWYYTDFEFENFFSNVNSVGDLNQQNLFKRQKQDLPIIEFHKEFKTKIEMLICELMPLLDSMEIDLRNWNKKFDMATLKILLLNTKSHKPSSLSQVLKRKKEKSNQHSMSKILSKINTQESIIKGGTTSKLDDRKQIKFDFTITI